MSPNIPKNPFLFGLFATKPHRKWAVSTIIIVLIATGFDGVTVVFLQYLTNAIAAKPIDLTQLWFWAILYPVWWLINGFVWRASGFTGMRWFTKLRFTANKKLYEHLTLHSKEYFNNRFAGSLTNKISNAVDGTASIFEDITWNFLPLIVGLLWYVFFSWLSNPWLGFIIWLWALLFLGINFLFAKKTFPSSYRASEANSILKGSIVDSLSNISLVHEYANVTGEQKYIETFIDSVRNKQLRAWFLSEWVLLVNDILIFIFIAVMLWLSIVLFKNHAISIGVIVMVIAIVSNLTGRLLFLGNQIKNTTKNYSQVKEGLEEILSEHKIVNAPQARTVAFSRGEIDINYITFLYGKKKVFEDFSLTIPPGQKVGLVGRSGAGKSTFVSLLLRHFDVQKGKILIDDQNIYEVTLESLRRAIAFVPQDTSLFHRSIKENISYSKPEATMKEIKYASRLAQADEFIENLSEKYNTLVGERGVKLSGGQRQRIAIARAFLKDAPILVLDEATSSLDSQSEYAIQMSLEELMKERTVIAIAHRLSTLKKMDRIVVIDRGKIVEDGNPDELIGRENGIFKAMWDHQVKGFIVDE